MASKKSSKVRKPEVDARRRYVEELARAEHASHQALLGPLAPRNPEQAHYLHLIRTKRITLASGVAGSGKTFVSMVHALEALERKEYERVVIVRPMVACGQDMGAMPGDEGEKYDPWLKPFLEIARLKLGESRLRTHLNMRWLQAEPLQTMRGSTFRRSFVILDEAQNVTSRQMKMFLTRLGEGSRMVLNGDDSQVDLPSYEVSGLTEAIERLSDLSEIGVIELTKSVRDPLIDKILKAYEKK